MKNYTGHEIGFPLDQWIDTKTGSFHSTGNTYKSDAWELASTLLDCVRHVFYIMDQDLCGVHYFDSEAPYIDMSGVNIKFSDKIKYTEKDVHRGIGALDSDDKWLMDRFQDSEEPLDTISRDELIKIKSLILGEFRTTASDKTEKIGTITLYNKAIAEFCAANGLDYTTVFWGTLARESFHAFHFNMFKRTGRRSKWNSGSNRKNREIVKDSLAAGFEAVFLLNHEGSAFDLAESRRLRSHLENTWREYDVEDYSYSGALNFEQWRPCMNTPQIYPALLKRTVYDWKTTADIIKTRYYMGDSVINDYLW